MPRQKSKAGRKPVLDGRKWLQVRIGDTRWNIYTKAAQIMGIPLSEMVRQVLDDFAKKLVGLPENEDGEQK